MALPTLSVEFSPTTGPFDTPVWVDITSRVLSLEWTDGKQADLDEFAPGEATVVLSNHDRLFDPEYAAGTYFGNLLPRVPFRIRATHSAVTYDLFYGFVEDGWGQDQAPPAWATCEVRLVDLLAVLAGYKLRSVFSSEVLADTPEAYWTLDESEGTVMHDRSGNGADGHYDNVEQGVDPLIIDAQGKAIEVAHVGDNRGEFKGTNLPTEAPVTLEAWVNFERDLTEIHTILVAQRDSAFGSSLWLMVERSGFGSPDGEVVIEFAGLGGFYKARGDATIDDGETHHVVMTMESTAAADIKLYVDGVEQTKTLISGTTGGTWTGHHIWCVGNVAASSLFDFGLGGIIDEVAVYPSALSAARVLAHYEAGSQGLAGYMSGEQIEWVLDAIGVPSTMHDLDTGVSIMGPLESTGRDALDVLREIAATEQGDLYVAHHDGGKLRFRDRYASFQDTRSTVTQATFSDDGAVADASAARVVPGTLQVEPNGVAGIINRTAVSWRGGEEIIDESAGSRYGPRGRSVATQASSSLVAAGIGQWIVNRNSTPQARIKALQIDPGSNHTEFPYALGTRIADRVAYRSLPQSVGSATTKALEVLGRRHAVAGLDWVTTFYLTEAPNLGVDLFTLGTSELGDPDILAY